MAGNAGDRSLMDTLTWAVALVCAVFHVLYSVLTMSLALAKPNSLMVVLDLKLQGNQNLKENMFLQSQTSVCSADPSRFRFTHQTSFVKRHMRLSIAIGIRWIVRY
ncbi:hypothetical protein BHE74_00023237 [Ensete ventricosum]|nr:hypothetical protein BHE74_00023237 [Ensete ventricosum]